MRDYRLANRLLAALDPADYARLIAAASLVDLVKSVDLALPDERAKFCWLPVSGLISFIATDEDDGSAEVGIVGNDGIADIGVALGDTVITCRMLVQVTGQALKIRAETIQQMVVDSGTLRKSMLAYARSFSSQIMSSALAFAIYPVPKRLARWLLMSADRCGEDGVLMTHEALAIMLGVRRSGVSVAVGQLVDSRFIMASRGRLAIVDRPGLARFAGGGYGAAERDYQRLVDRPASV